MKRRAPAAGRLKVPDEDLEKWIVAWPGRVPKKAKAAPKPNGQAKRAEKSAA